MIKVRAFEPGDSFEIIPRKIFNDQENLHQRTETMGALPESIAYTLYDGIGVVGIMRY